jgi:hypothetical protein
VSAAPFTAGQGDRQPPLTVVVSGRIRNVVCAAGQPIMEVMASTGVLRLVIDDPLAIAVRGTATNTADLQCGPQDVPIRVGYVPTVDPARTVAGKVRLLDYGE